MQCIIQDRPTAHSLEYTVDIFLWGFNVEVKTRTIDYPLICNVILFADGEEKDVFEEIDTSYS